MNKELEYINEKYSDDLWELYPPSKKVIAILLEDYAKKYHAEMLKKICQ